MSTEDTNEPPLGKLPYERQHREEPPPSLEEQQTLALDPLKWKPVSLGLALIFWGYVTILAMAGSFTVLYLFNIIKVKIDVEDIREIGMGAGLLSLLGIVMIIAGQCFCVAVPIIARARSLIVLSVAAMATVVISLGVFLVTMEPQLDPQPPTPDTPPPVQAAPAADPPMPEIPAIKKGPLWPGLSVSMSVKLFILGTYLVGQILFILFLKRVAIFFHNIFLADSMGGYLTLFVIHTLLFALLPPAALIACFFWVIMLALKFVLALWLLKMLAATRKAIG